MKAKAGDFVRIHNIVLKVGERADNLPEDTKKVPLEMWDKGFLINPVFRHNYGEFVPELLQIGLQARKILFGGEDNE